MSTYILYALTGTGLFCIGLNALLTYAQLFKKILAINVMAAGVSLILVAMAGRVPGQAPDPVPLALVITGIVVLVSATAFALALQSHLNAENVHSDLTKKGDD